MTATRCARSSASSTSSSQCGSRSMSKQRLPAAITRILEQLQRGKVLCKYLHQRGPGGTKERWSPGPGGWRVSTIQARKALTLGLLNARGDGLFSADSQTYEASR